MTIPKRGRHRTRDARNIRIIELFFRLTRLGVKRHRAADRIARAFGVQSRDHVSLVLQLIDDRRNLPAFYAALPRILVHRLEHRWMRVHQLREGKPRKPTFFDEPEVHKGLEADLQRQIAQDEGPLDFC